MPDFMWWVIAGMAGVVTLYFVAVIALAVWAILRKD